MWSRWSFKSADWSIQSDGIIGVCSTLWLVGFHITSVAVVVYMCIYFVKVNAFVWVWMLVYIIWCVYEVWNEGGGSTDACALQISLSSCLSKWARDMRVLLMYVGRVCLQVGPLRVCLLGAYIWKGSSELVRFAFGFRGLSWNVML